MTEPPVIPPPPEAVDDDMPDMAAAELALGVLEGEERALAIRRVLAEPGFAREVERWRGHFGAWFAEWPEAEVPDMLPRIERSLDRPPAPAEAVAALPARTRGIWPGLAVLSSIAAAVLLVVLLTRPVAGPPVPAPAPIVAALPTLVASITPSAKGAPVTAVYDARAGRLRLTEAAFPRAGRSAELWVIPAGGTPHALGLLRAKGGTVLALSAGTRAHIAAGATLAVSLEPVGGSPTGQPTGPVVATGALSHV